MPDTDVDELKVGFLKKIFFQYLAIPKVTLLEKVIFLFNLFVIIVFELSAVQWCGSGSRSWTLQIFLFLFAYFNTKTQLTIQKEKKIWIVSFFKSSELGVESFWLIFCPLDPHVLPIWAENFRMVDIEINA